MSEIQNYLNYAFLDKNNIVVNVSVFESNDTELLEIVRLHFNAQEYVACVDFDNKISYGYHRYNGKFYPPQPYPSWIRNEELNEWEPPVPYPVIEDGGDEQYVWDENTISWLLLPPA